MSLFSAIYGRSQPVLMQTNGTEQGADLYRGDTLLASGMTLILGQEENLIEHRQDGTVLLVRSREAKVAVNENLPWKGAEHVNLNEHFRVNDADETRWTVAQILGKSESWMTLRLTRPEVSKKTVPGVIGDR